MRVINEKQYKKLHQKRKKEISDQLQIEMMEKNYDKISNRFFLFFLTPFLPIPHLRSCLVWSRKTNPEIFGFRPIYEQKSGIVKLDKTKIVWYSLHHWFRNLFILFWLNFCENIEYMAKVFDKKASNVKFPSVVDHRNCSKTKVDFE